MQDTYGEIPQEELTQHTVRILIKGGSKEDNLIDAVVVLEESEVLSGLRSVTKACIMLLGLIYAVNLSYPKELRYTFEFFQKIMLELDSGKLSPKILSLKNKLLS